MFKHIIIAVAFASLTSVQAAAAPSICKGLDEAACSTKSGDGCIWQKAIHAGDTTKAGAPSKVSRKAHCRVKRPTAVKQ